MRAISGAKNAGGDIAVRANPRKAFRHGNMHKRLEAEGSVRNSLWPDGRH